MWIDQIIHIFDLAKAFSTRYPPWRNPPHLSWLWRSNHVALALWTPTYWNANQRLGFSAKMRSNLQVLCRIFTGICVWKIFPKAFLPVWVAERCFKRYLFFFFFLSLFIFTTAVNSCCLTTEETSQLERTMECHSGPRMSNSCRCLYKLPW